MAEDKKPINTDISTLLEEVLNSDQHWVWEFLLKEKDIDTYSPEHIERFQEAFQEADDAKRENQGLEPRPWTEVAKDLQEQTYQEINSLEQDEKQIEEWSEPRSTWEFRADMLRKFVMISDGRSRRKRGLEPQQAMARIYDKKGTIMERFVAYLDDVLANEQYPYWEFLARPLAPYSPTHLKENRQAIQSYDDQKRKGEGLEPRPWSEIVNEFQQRRSQEALLGSQQANDIDARDRQAQGLEPRSLDENDDLIYSLFDLMMEEFARRHDTRAHLEKGLLPRSEGELAYAVEWMGLRFSDMTTDRAQPSA
ncbi:MAG: hypothetical protein Q9218_006296 [Villophora microphyllina]